MDKAGGRADGITDAGEKRVDRKQPIRTHEGQDLIDRRKKGDSIDRSEQAEDEEAGEPIGWTLLD